MDDIPTAVVTGASSGLGKAAATELARKGYRIIGTGRDLGRTADAEREIRRNAGPGARVDLICADLSLMRETRDMADRILVMTDRIDLLLNNAGGMVDRAQLTDEGLEAGFAANHLAHFLLTSRLVPLLERTAARAPAGSVRIVVTSSGASEAAPPINFEDIQGLSTFSTGLAYCIAKLANVMHARELATRLADKGIAVHIAAPGPVASRFFENASQETRDHVRDMPMMTSEQGAALLLQLALDDEPGSTTGGYWKDGLQVSPHPQALDEAALAAFWIESEKLISRALGAHPSPSRQSLSRDALRDGEPSCR